jgi:hypothetical protein
MWFLHMRLPKANLPYKDRLAIIIDTFLSRQTR